MTGADTKARDVAPVKPSSRDPIAQWLDVFTSLLALPAGESERIRDELEDHLRTRVDDLLILGMSEPEAVQKAVTELGETAQLARNFKAVRTHSRRRIAMHTALFAAAGLALTVSVAGFLPKSNTAPITTSPAIVEAQPEGVQANGILDQDLPAGTLGDMLNILAESGQARLFVHWNVLEGNVGLDAETEVPAIPSKGLQHSKVKQLLNSSLDLQGENQLDARFEDGLLEIATREYFDRIETITLDHDVSVLVPSDHVLQQTDEGIQLVRSIQSIVEPEGWDVNGGLWSITINGSLLSTRAPERVQKLVIDYIARLEAAQRKNTDEVRRKELQDEEAAMAFHEQSLRESAEAKERLVAEYHQLQSELEGMNVQYWKSDYALKDHERAYHAETNQELKAERLDDLAAAGARHDSLKAQRDLLQDQIKAKRLSIQNVENNISYMRAVVADRSSIGRGGPVGR